MSNDWMTPELRQLTAQFDAAVAEATRASRDASAAARETARRDVTAAPEYQRLERKVAEYFRSGQCGPVARELQTRVDRGDLTWRQIREGGVDPEATRLYLENQDVMLAGIATVHRRNTDDADGEPPNDDPDDDGPVFRSIFKGR